VSAEPPTKLWHLTVRFGHEGGEFAEQEVFVVAKLLWERDGVLARVARTLDDTRPGRPRVVVCGGRGGVGEDRGIGIGVRAG
jgi:hypothetical protein